MTHDYTLGLTELFGDPTNDLPRPDLSDLLSGGDPWVRHQMQRVGHQVQLRRLLMGEPVPGELCIGLVPSRVRAGTVDEPPRRRVTAQQKVLLDNLRALSCGRGQALQEPELRGLAVLIADGQRYHPKDLRPYDRKTWARTLLDQPGLSESALQTLIAVPSGGAGELGMDESIVEKVLRYPGVTAPVIADLLIATYHDDSEHRVVSRKTFPGSWGPRPQPLLLIDEMHSIVGSELARAANTSSSMNQRRIARHPDGARLSRVLNTVTVWQRAQMRDALHRVAVATSQQWETVHVLLADAGENLSAAQVSTLIDLAILAD